MNGSSNDMKTRMAKYEQELLRLRNRGASPAATTSPAPTQTLLRVKVISEQRPIIGALVTITGQSGEERTLRFVRFTDQNGEIEALTLPTDSHTVYDVTATAPGFARRSEVGPKPSEQAKDITIVLQPLDDYGEEW